MTQISEALVVIYVALFIAFLGAVLMVAALGVLGLGAWSWGNAIAAAHRARSHGLSVDEQAAINAEAHQAIDEARETVKHRRPPTDRELKEAIFAERELDDREHNTMESNENIEEQPLIPPDALYVTEAEDAFSG